MDKKSFNMIPCQTLFYGQKLVLQKNNFISFEWFLAAAVAACSSSQYHVVVVVVLVFVVTELLSKFEFLGLLGIP